VFGSSGGILDVTIDASRLTGTTLADGVVNSSLSKVATLTSGATGVGFLVDISRSTLLGTIGWGNLPTGTGTWTAQPTIIGMLTVNGGIRVLDNIEPQVNFRSNLGRIEAKFLSAYIAELFVETLVAQDVMATIGGRILVCPTTSLTLDLAPAATTITVKHNNLLNGHLVRLEGNGQVEWMAITSSAGGVAGAYVYSVTRNLDGTGANQWYIGDAVANTRTTGDGFIDLYSTGGVLSGSGPTIVGNVRTGTTYSQVAARWAIGNLNGLYGYVADTYGAAFGDATAANLVIDATSGLRIRNGTTVFAQLAASVFTVGAAGGNRLEWDATNLTVRSANLTIDQNGVAISTTSGGQNAGHAYAFTGTPSFFGLYGADESAASSLWLNVVTSTRPTHVVVQAATGSAQAALDLQCGSSAASSSQAILSAYNTNVQATNTVTIQGAVVTVTGPVTMSSTLGVSSSLEVGGQTFLDDDLLQKTSQFLYPGSASGLSNYQTSYYLASHTTYGLYSNTGLYLASHLQLGANLLQATSQFLYPGSASGLSSFQTSYYLASHATWGLYTNTSLALVGGVYIGSGQTFSFTGDTDTYMGSDTANRLALVAGGVRIFWDGTQLFPEGNGTKNLGVTGNFRWNAIYLINAPVVESDAREKKNVQPTAYGSAFLRALRPVDFEWNRTEWGAARYSGFLAQEVHAVAPSFGGLAFDEGGVANSLSYEAFVAPLVQGFQDLDARIRALEARS
jgi:hypothetical protein